MQFVALALAAACFISRGQVAAAHRPHLSNYSSSYEAPFQEGAFRRRSTNEPENYQNYVLVISGTMNPPHRGHVTLGFEAVMALEAKGHKVVKCLFAPVHDNYMWNKVTEKGGTTPVFPMGTRVKLLRQLIDDEAERRSMRNDEKYDAADYEAEYGTLQESGDWAEKLAGGYLKTVPTASLINGMAEKMPDVKNGRNRLGLVFGIDNLAGMPSWSEEPGVLLERADLVLLGRAEQNEVEVSFSTDPAELLQAVKYVEVEDHGQIKVMYGGKVLFGSEVGRFTNTGARAEASATLSLLPQPLINKMGEFSSTTIRNCLDELGKANLGTPSQAQTQCIDTLRDHGYESGAVNALLTDLAKQSDTLTRIRSRGIKRGEFVSSRLP